MTLTFLQPVAKRGARHGKSDKTKVQALHDNASELVDCAHCTTPDQTEKATRLVKAGARHAKKDLERIRKVHDLAVELGATCPTDSVAKD